MNGSTLMILLPIATFALVIGFSMWNKKKVEERREDDSARKSTLAVDAPNYR
ncbi:MAG: hypothetical protein AAF762_11205 [Pseudomonadota bacterium]